MRTHLANFKHAVATLVVCVVPQFAFAQDADGQSRAADLLAELSQAADADSAERLERALIYEWSRTGSPALDLLLTRGRAALDVNDHKLAVEHLTALTDHAPEFAEGWHQLALAYFHSASIGPAIDALERALALNPNHFPALRGTAIILEGLGKHSLAEQAYQAVLNIRPHDSNAQAALDRLASLTMGTAL
jgi:tetratricopeptide (TPR) repeat protein